MLDDRKIREMLQNAEVKAPRRIWSSVSSRLDAIEGRRTPEAVWEWVGAVAALAAVVVAGVFIVGGGRGTVEVTDGPVLAETFIDLPATDPVRVEQSAEVARPVRVVPVKKENHVLFADAGNIPAVGETRERVDEAADRTEPAIPAGKPAPAECEEESFVTDGAVLDRMEKEDDFVRSGRRTDIIIGGALSGNTPSKSFRSSMRGGVEAIPDSDIIKETGASDFGVPFTVGVGFRCYLAPRFSIGSGVDYSLLTRTFSGSYTAAASSASIHGEFRNTMHYIGIPVRLYCDIIDAKAIDLYVYGGGEVEYCVSNKYAFHSGAAAPEDFAVRQKVQGLQFSAGLGIGVQFRLSDHIGLYLDPGVIYYFYGGQPRSIRTERPLMFNLNAGLRLDLRKK